MEIHQSSLIYTPRNKSPLPAGKIQRANEKNSQKTKQGVEVTLSNDSKADLTATYPEQQGKTKSAPPSLQFDVLANQSVDIRTKKALIAYNTEQHQRPLDHAAQLVTGVDYIV